MQHVPRGFDGRALNELRELDPSRLTAWQEVQHRQRLVQLLSELPQLPELLVSMGFETNHDWLRCLQTEAHSGIAA